MVFVSFGPHLADANQKGRPGLGAIAEWTRRVQRDRPQRPAIPLTADRRGAVAGKRRTPRPNSKTSPMLCCSTNLQRSNRSLYSTRVEFNRGSPSGIECTWTRRIARRPLLPVICGGSRGRQAIEFRCRAAARTGFCPVWFAWTVRTLCQRRSVQSPWWSVSAQRPRFVS